MITRRVFGPEAGTLESDKFFKRLSQIAREISATIPNPGLNFLILNFTLDGKFAEGAFARPLKDGIRRCKLDSTLYLLVDVGVTMQTLELGDVEFYHVLREFLGDALGRAEAALKKRNIQYDQPSLHRAFSELVEGTRRELGSVKRKRF